MTKPVPLACVADVFLVENRADVVAINQCEIVYGNIELRNYGEQVLNLGQVQHIQGDLVIENSASLFRVEANGLKLITGKFRMDRLNVLALVQMPNLASVDAIEWLVLPLLTMATIQSLKEVKSLLVSDTSLSHITNLAAPKMLNVDVNNNRYMELCSLEVEEISNRLHLAANALNFRANLDRLKSAHNVTVSEVLSLEMALLADVQGTLSIVANDFQSFSLPALQRVGGTFRIAENQHLQKASVDALKDVEGGLLIVNNTGLTTIDFFPNLTAIGGALELVGDIEATKWPSLHLVKGSISLHTTNRIFDCQSWTSGSMKNALRGGEIECHHCGLQPDQDSLLSSQLTLDLGAMGVTRSLIRLAALLSLISIGMSS